MVEEAEQLTVAYFTSELRRYQLLGAMHDVGVIEKANGDVCCGAKGEISC